MNKGKSDTEKNYITDNNLYLLGGIFAHLTFYFGYNFYLQSFFGISL